MRWFHVLAFVAVIGTTKTQGSEQADAKKWLKEYNIVFGKILNNQVRAEYTYNTDITDEHQKEQVTANVEMAAFLKEASQNASSFNWKKFKDADIKRQMKKISDIGPSALKEHKKVEELNKALSDMQSIYSKATVFLQNKTMNLEPGLTELFASSRDYDLLTEGWKLWRDASGAKMKTLYQRMVELSNEGSKENGYHDTGAFWRTDYEDDNFQDTVEELLVQLKPIYTELHTYIRKKLKDLYGADKFPKTGQIPAHILGNMWAQTWNNIYSLVIPYPNKPSVDVTDALKEQNFTATRMFRTAEHFFKSIGLDAMPATFWNGSMIERPSDGRDVVCYAAAWDMGDGKDFRIKMCTDITMEDLITIHHEMGHVEYFLQYKDQPSVFRDGANPGFHEAIGDTIALSVSTPKHLRKIGLLPAGENDYEADINYLMKIALEKIAFLPFGYLIDQWRWSVFSGETTPDNYNRKWWDLRCKYQGISPPVKRTEEDFDPGAKYHVAANVPYIRYFISFVIQFQFHQSLCREANQTGPLHTCDIYNSLQAGTKLKNMLKLGSSVQWQDAMELITGQRKMEVGPLLEYFKPLMEWLEKKNGGDGESWTDNCPDPSSGGISDLEQADKFLDMYNERDSEIWFQSSELSWAYNTNLTDYNAQRKTEYSLKTANFAKEVAANASMFDWENFHNETRKRQFSFVAQLGTSAMKDVAKLKRVSTIRSLEVENEMESVYSKGKVCLSGHTECMSLEPGLTRLLRSSSNYSELTEVWEGWRDATGPKIRPLYQQFVELSNEGYRAAGYNDTSEAWISNYETENFKEDLQELLEQLKPLYQQLHTYVRGKLIEKYGKEHFPSSGHIPAHLMGNMWAQTWSNIFPLLEPYPGKGDVDVTPEMLNQNYTVERMFRTAEEFFLSLGLKKMPNSFWNKSMLQKPTDGRDVVCHASAWDFGNTKDFRIKMCTDITMEDLITIHHEMGHIQYYLQYKDQPTVFRGGANPGFHEAVGDVLAISVATPRHLNKIGLLPNLKEDNETDLNFLMSLALDKIAFLPFGYLIDQWRWSVFRGQTPPDEYNRQWWDLRCKYQGISPPTKRTEDDFDPGAKYHVPANTPYIRYFVSFVIQFQFHKALCQAANHTGPLYKCDIYQSKEAGQKLANMLSLGTSKPWPEAMEAITGQRKMDVRPLVEFFTPLLDWLEKQNSGKKFGWSDECPTGTDGKIRDLDAARKWLKQYDNMATDVRFKSVEAEYTYSTNITKYNSGLKV
ncbi:hypothetical protein LOTGIDRAFT_215685 [Lottia gigantea]|uniref:Angiotensin-converting enzyme n=1 Tax=Lottia gigantea TaxID=225164 RepID=V4AKT8_LOTGI|nr:hypothetical protein LOTGIDRAFT_215685 [Lottia gigantea]ESO94196.1 hypothetical protein LOTGIDRAFT_215685 [Lottia gigantea]